MINLKKNKKILGCFFNGERVIDILNHKGESMLDFSGTLNYFKNLQYPKDGEEINLFYEDYKKIGFKVYYYSNNFFDLKSKYPLDLEYMIEQDNLDVFEKTSSKFNFKLYGLLIQRYFLDEFFADALKTEHYDKVNYRWYSKEITKEEIKTLFKVNFDFDFEKVKTILTNISFTYFYPERTMIFLKSVHTQIIENVKIKELVYDIFKNPDFYIEKYESLKEFRKEQIIFNILDYKTVNPLYFRNTDDDVFIMQSELKEHNYNNIQIHVANKTSSEVTLEICYIAYNIENKKDFTIPANSKDYIVDFYDANNKDLYFIRRKDGKLLNNKYHTNGWVRLF